MVGECEAQRSGVGFNLKARVLPVRGVGVQGDERTYAHTALLTGEYDELAIAELSPAITNSLRDVNRVVFWAGAKGSIDEFRVEPTTTSREGLDVLREADARVRDILAEYDTQKRIWQCPVVMLPLKRQGESTIVDQARGVARRHDRAVLAPAMAGHRAHRGGRSRGPGSRRPALRRDEQAARDDRVGIGRTAQKESRAKSREQRASVSTCDIKPLALCS